MQCLYQCFTVFTIVIAVSHASVGYFRRSEGSDASEIDLMFRRFLCPNIPRDILAFYHFHPSSRKCYQAGTQGPCGSHMIFVKLPNAHAAGRCICNDVEKMPERPMIRHPATNNCYYVYRPAFCAPNEWLVQDEINDEGRCELNPCFDLETIRENEVDARELVPYGGACVELGRPSDLCDSNQVVRFEGTFPTCANLTSIDNEILES